MAKAKRDIEQEVTDKIIAQLEKGTAPWQKGWAASGVGTPRRFTGQPYKGINVLILAMQGRSHDTWMTYRQAAELGGQVRGGEAATTVVLFKPVKTTDKATGEEKTFSVLRTFNVFCADQIDNLPAKYQPAPVAVVNPDEQLAAVDAYISATLADIRYGGARAYYSPSQDFIQLPEYDQFHTSADFYGTALHELVHWTGADSRLRRDLKVNGTKDYAKEELTAELGAAFLCAHLGVTGEPRADHASYIESWLSALKGDKKFVFRSAALAQKAVDFLDDLQTLELEQAA